jgi:hypothetical protein
MARNDHTHDFVGAFQYLMDAAVAQQAFDRIVADITASAPASTQLMAISVDDVKPRSAGARVRVPFPALADFEPKGQGRMHSGHANARCYS